MAKRAGTSQLGMEIVFGAATDQIGKLTDGVIKNQISVKDATKLLKVMGDVYKSAVDDLTRSLDKLAPHSNKLGTIAEGLTKIGAGLKTFNTSTKHVEGIKSLADSLDTLTTAVTWLAKIEGLDTLGDKITLLAKGISKIKFTDGQVKSLERGIVAVTKLKDAAKGGIDPIILPPSDGGGGGGRRGGGGGGGGKGDDTEPTGIKERAWGLVKTGAKLLGGLALTENNQREINYRELAQTTRFETSNIGNAIPGTTGHYTRDSDRTAGIKQAINSIGSELGVAHTDTTSNLALGARYLFGSQGGEKGIESMSPDEIQKYLKTTTTNSQLGAQMTNMSMSEVQNMQGYMQRDLGIKTGDLDMVTKSLISLGRAGSLTAKDLESVGSNARDSMMAMNVRDQEAAKLLQEQMLRAQAAGTAGLKADDSKGALSGRFGNIKAFVFDQLAGITEEDYKLGENHVRRKHQQALGNLGMNMLPHTALGAVSGQQMLNAFGVTEFPDMEKYLRVTNQSEKEGKLIDTIQEVMAKDLADKAGDAFKPVTTTAQALSQAFTELKSAAIGFGQFISRGGAEMGKPLEVNDNYYKNVASDRELMASSNEGGYVSEPGVWNTPVEKKETGGLVQGSGSSDSVKTLLKPGEEVLTKSDPRHRTNIDKLHDFVGMFGLHMTDPDNEYKGQRVGLGHARHNAIDTRSWGPSAARMPEAITYAKNMGWKVIDKLHGTAAHVHFEIPQEVGIPSLFREPETRRPPLMEMASSSQKVGIPSLFREPETRRPPLMEMASSSQKESQTVKLDPTTIASFSNAAGASDAAGDKISQAADELLHAVQMLISSGRSSSGSSAASLASIAARGSFAFGA